jgi:hypothetical protein
MVQEETVNLRFFSVGYFTARQSVEVVQCRVRVIFVFQEVGASTATS